ncbi:hypothetical protein CAOG_00918 [Capsaspora owczarzaki ATCC 30864]|uniref:Ima1 N-terminal domain-containing protein n=1 Tax=Capsaspora owczarzaki (strain ATCC 30864) TaxID=595528 RepID=A0A0D2X0Q2_CAPO3|nr:hypothetical protein CAOG_00918 [Capsaspora owczarzaki ATCC 30864]KJE89454.1 hypothetical protein CAOG_000918 [Capsaspora owczarzaki ATCC 30864]|eukprot:XP_004365789.1 hypothetical protein CAOG_00918 [Capsaspora owczarzaki ATCC 30864]
MWRSIWGGLVAKHRPSQTVASVECWFCRFRCQVAVDAVNSWTCTSCLQYNGFDEDGDYNQPIPGQADESLNPRFHVASLALSAQTPTWRFGQQPANLQQSHPVLCTSCSRNQEIKMAQLASFEPQNENAFDEEVDAYRLRLERIFSLCGRCTAAVQSELVRQREAETLQRVEELINRTHQRPIPKSIRPHIEIGLVACTQVAASILDWLLVLVTLGALLEDDFELGLQSDLHYSWFGQTIAVAVSGSLYKLAPALVDTLFTTNQGQHAMQFPAVAIETALTSYLPYMSLLQLFAVLLICRAKKKRLQRLHLWSLLIRSCLTLIFLSIVGFVSNSKHSSMAIALLFGLSVTNGLVFSFVSIVHSLSSVTTVPLVVSTSLPASRSYSPAPSEYGHHCAHEDEREHLALDALSLHDAGKARDRSTPKPLHGLGRTSSGSAPSPSVSLPPSPAVSSLADLDSSPRLKPRLSNLILPASIVLPDRPSPLRPPVSLWAKRDLEMMQIDSPSIHEASTTTQMNIEPLVPASLPNLAEEFEELDRLRSPSPVQESPNLQLALVDRASQVLLHLTRLIPFSPFLVAGIASVVLNIAFGMVVVSVWRGTSSPEAPVVPTTAS